MKASESALRLFCFPARMSRDINSIIGSISVITTTARRKTNEQALPNRSRRVLPNRTPLSGRKTMSVEPDVQLDPYDPMATEFSIKNENQFFDVSNVRPVCINHAFLTDHGFGLRNVHNIIAGIPVLDSGQKSTIKCYSIIPGVGAPELAGMLVTAYVEIDVTYRQDWWPVEKEQHFPFKVVLDTKGGVHWTHITQEETERDLSRKAN